jgi:hypothetical protein
MNVWINVNLKYGEENGRMILRWILGREIARIGFKDKV